MTRLSSEHVFSGVAPSPCLDPTDGVSPYSVTGQVSAYRPTRTWEGTANVSFAGSCCGRGGHSHNNGTLDSKPPATTCPPSLLLLPIPQPFCRHTGYLVWGSGGEVGGQGEEPRERERGAYCTFQPIRASFEPLARSRSRHSLPSPSSAPPPDCPTACTTV